MGRKTVSTLRYLSHCIVRYNITLVSYIQLIPTSVQDVNLFSKKVKNFSGVGATFALGGGTGGVLD